MTSVISSKRGFTLIEVIVAIFFLMVALLGLLSLTTTVIKGNAISKMTTLATTLAKDKLENVKNQDYADITAATDYLTSNGSVSESSSGAFYTRTCEVTENSPATNMKNIRVTVQWQWNGASRSISTSTIVSL